MNEREQEKTYEWYEAQAKETTDLRRIMFELWKDDVDAGDDYYFPDKVARKYKQLQTENERLKKAILDYGKNPAGFDWAVLERIEQLEKAVALLNSMLLCGEKHSNTSRKVVEQALKGKDANTETRRSS